MKGLFSFQFIVFVYFMFILLSSANSFFKSVYTEEYTTGFLNNNSNHPMNVHNMTQMMQRGAIAMGFDQNKISHEFSSTQDGGQIKIKALDENDDQTINEIRSHTRDIQNDFAEGNFTKPFYIHAQSVPGTDTMSQNKDQIQYQIKDLKNGSILLLITNKSSLINSINEFMTYQSTEHKLVS